LTVSLDPFCQCLKTWNILLWIPFCRSKLVSFVNMAISPKLHEKHVSQKFATVGQVCVLGNWYGVATISRMLKNIGLFCKRALQKRPVFCKETCIFKHLTHRSHPIEPERNNGMQGGSGT